MRMEQFIKLATKCRHLERIQEVIDADARHGGAPIAPIHAFRLEHTEVQSTDRTESYTHLEFI